MSKTVKIIMSAASLLLIISFGINLYFVNQSIKDQRQSEINRGKNLILSYYDATVFAGIIRDTTADILKNDSPETRLNYKYQIGLASRYTQSIPSLIAGAEEITGKSFMQMKYNKQHYFTEIINVLGSIVSHNETLPQDEITYLQTVHDLFVKVDDWLKGYTIENTADELALDMIKGGTWVGITEQINNLFAESPDFLFTYRSTHDVEDSPTSK